MTIIPKGIDLIKVHKLTKAMQMAKHITQTHSGFAGQLTKLVTLDISCDNPTHSQDRVTKNNRSNKLCKW